MKPGVVWQLRRSSLGLAALAVQAIIGPDAQAQQPGAVTGVVFDSLSLRPLAGAHVQLSLTGRLAGRVVDTDGSGAFRFDSVPPGTYLMTFSHPVLDSLGLEAAVTSFEAGARAVRQVRLSTPSAATLIRLLCPAGAIGDSTGLLLGHVADAETRERIANSALTLRWPEVVVEDHGLRVDQREYSVTTNAGGWFAVCNLPSGIDVAVQAHAEGRASGRILMQIPWRSLVHRELYVSRVNAGPLAAKDTLGATRGLANGTARVDGRVVDSNGRGLAGAHAYLRQTTSNAIAREDGTFSLLRAPFGTQSLDVVAVGYVPERRTIDILVGDEAGPLLVQMTNARHFLDTVRVTASRIYSSDAGGFERRRRSALGRFFTSEDFSKHAGMFITDYIGGTMGISLAPAAFGQTVMMRGWRGEPCYPTVFVDRMRFGGGLSGESDGNSNVDDWAWPDEVDGVEIYARANEIPPEFFSSNACGVIVIWTNRSRASVQPRTRRD